MFVYNLPECHDNVPYSLLCIYFLTQPSLVSSHTAICRSVQITSLTPWIFTVPALRGQADVRNEKRNCRVHTCTYSRRRVDSEQMTVIANNQSDTVNDGSRKPQCLQASCSVATTSSSLPCSPSMNDGRRTTYVNTQTLAHMLHLILQGDISFEQTFSLVSIRLQFL